MRQWTLPTTKLVYYPLTPPAADEARPGPWDRAHAGR